MRPADANLEDEDLLEMVNTGLLPMAIVDSHKAQFWAQVFDDIRVRTDLAVNTGGEIAWAMRKGSPKLRQMIDGFVKTSRQGTLLGNILYKKYLRNTTYVKNSTSEAELRKFQRMVEIFKQYAGQYRFDYLMIIAQGYQESQLDQERRSMTGAIRVMQVLPKTARDPAVGIPDVTKLDNNIHAGVKYLRFMTDRYFDAPEVDAVNRMLFAFATYNAGACRGRAASEAGGPRGPESQRLVRQRGARGGGGDRAGNGSIRQPHLQVLPRLPARGGDRRGARRSAPGRDGRALITSSRR